MLPYSMPLSLSQYALGCCSVWINSLSAAIIACCAAAVMDRGVESGAIVSFIIIISP